LALQLNFIAITIIKVIKSIIKLFINFKVLAINFVLAQHLIMVVDLISFEYGNWKFVKQG
jgi:hypothetical protein